MLPSGKQRASAQNPQHAQQLTEQRQLRKRFWEEVGPDVRRPYADLIGKANGYRDTNVAQSALWKASKGIRQQQQPTWQLQWMEPTQPGGAPQPSSLPRPLPPPPTVSTAASARAVASSAASAGAAVSTVASAGVAGHAAL